MVTADGAVLDLSPGSVLVIDGAEWTIERTEPHCGRAVLVSTGGQRMPVTFRFLINHPGCRQSTRQAAARPADRHRQPAELADLTGRQRELVAPRMAHLPEVETGFRSGDPMHPGPGEPKPCYDAASTTWTQRRRAKAAELAALDRDETRMLGLNRVSFRTLVRWEQRRSRLGGCGPARAIRVWPNRSGKPSTRCTPRHCTARGSACGPGNG